MSARRIVLLTGSPLHTNPRAVKEATALSAAGYAVTVHGAWSREGGGGGGVSVERCFGGNGGRLETEVGGVESDLRLAARGGYAFVPLLPPHTLEGKLHRLVQRAARKVMPWSKWSFGLMPLVLAREAGRLKPDLAIAHSEAGILAALQLHRQGCRVGVDMEDWFSEDLPAQARKGRPVELLQRSERKLLRCAAYATCTSEAMADALAAEYGGRRPVRIYNVFPRPAEEGNDVPTDRGPEARSLAGTPSRGREAVSIHWFSQTLGPGRGLEQLFQAAAGLDGNGEVHLRGHIGNYGPWLDSVVPEQMRSRVFHHAPVPSGELTARIAGHDIGFAGETRSIRSRNLTATNKIFQYLQGGLAVLASDTAGQREVAAASGTALQLYREDDPDDLRARLGALLEDPQRLRAARAAARTAGETLHWENESRRLVDAVRASLE